MVLPAVVPLPCFTPRPGANPSPIDGWDGTISYFLPHLRRAVWGMLTDPAAIRLWLGEGVIERYCGGMIVVTSLETQTLIDGAITAYEPLRLLCYAWGAPSEFLRSARWALRDEAAGTRLTLTVSVGAGDDIEKVCALFGTHIEMLSAALDGAPIRFPYERYFRMRRYNSKILPPVSLSADECYR